MILANFLYDFRFGAMVLFHIADTLAAISTQSVVRDHLKRVFFPCCNSTTIAVDA